LKDFGPDLDELVDRMLRKDPKDQTLAYALSQADLPTVALEHP